MPTNSENLLTGFPVSGDARDFYEFKLALFTYTGKAHISDFHDARTFAHSINQKRDLIVNPEKAVRASQINAIALIHGILQYIFRLYCEQHGAGFLRDTNDQLSSEFGDESLRKTLKEALDQFPPLPVYLRELDDDHYLSQNTHARANRDLTLEELLMLWLANGNPAFSPLMELFSDTTLKEKSLYLKVITALREYFDRVALQDTAKGGMFTGGQNIVDFLLAPVRAAPDSLEGQLAYILEHWNALVGAYIYRLLRGLDLIKEEYKPVFGGPGPSEVPVYEPEMLERFSPDRDWMPNLVLMAKNAYVWLDQLSKKYGRPITRLDQVPDQELDILARWGFSGLWLIGLWERSGASKEIKIRCGNPDAVASAYSLYDYQIAADLGGEAACDNLKQRAWRRGIRLASDMVPNHVGIDGRWMMEHPDWFISLDYSPFPTYSFNGPDLSRDERVGIFLEDHYYDRSDAAVVFKRVDRWTGSQRFVYHGNDGTSMPWNDTAQLNYLNPEMREAMIQTILHIARQFPVIRFDAAMTLAKRSIQRLWFPEPGSGGAIPSRAEHGMSRAEFDAAIPNEFWREVVDRVAQEVPDTLLLAEAFWMMEGYFVRTLGMHRVYNSAFMNMLRDEENSKYRLVMKNTLEFDPEVLKRYVNFMNNPDERTAVDQFGKDGKYFGVAILMATMPGLPMFGHGQIEGFAEKYGMEYRRAYWDEKIDDHLLRRHEKDIFPLLRKRYLFAGVANFLLYDFYSPEGTVNEDVFAYSNAAGSERTLVIYHNRYASAKGWIRNSAAYSVKTGNGDARTLVRRTLGEGLGLQADWNQFCIFRDHSADLEYIRNCKDLCEQGLYVDLGAYQYHVFTDFRVVTDDATQQYRRVADFLGGRGVPSVRETMQEIYVRPVLAPFQALVNAEMFQRLLEARVMEPEQSLDEQLLEEVEKKVIDLLRSIMDFLQIEPSESESIDPSSLAASIRQELETVLMLASPEYPLLAETENQPVRALSEALHADTSLWGGLLGWVFVHALGMIADPVDGSEQSRGWLDEWLFGKTIRNTLREIGLDDGAANHALAAIKLLTANQRLLETPYTDSDAETVLAALLQDNDVQQFLNINRYGDVLWFNKESFEP